MTFEMSSKSLNPPLPKSLAQNNTYTEERDCYIVNYILLTFHDYLARAAPSLKSAAIGPILRGLAVV